MMGKTSIRSRLPVGERHKLVAMCFIIAALNYSLRFNLSFGIVAMVSEDNDTTVETKSDPLNSNSSKSSSRHQTEMCPSLGSSSKTTPNITTQLEDMSKSFHSPSSPQQQSTPTFQWDERDQGLILGSFFWGYMLSQFPGGLLAQKYGGKWIIAGATLAAGILSICLPQAAILGGKHFVIGVRVLQGVAEGFVIPAMVNLKAKWFPPEERARLAAICFAGFPFGTALTMLMSGQVIPVYGWPAVFYLPGVLTIVLSIVWTMIVHASPEDHPSISADELMHIKKSIGSLSKCDHGPDPPEVSKITTNKDDALNLRNVPWKEISCSLPVWIAFISQFCNCWGHNMLKSEGPKYLHSALHFNIHENSYVAAAPYFAQMLFSPFIARLSDLLLERKLISMLTARKLCNTIGQWGMALTFVGIIASGCNRLPAVIFLILSGMASGTTLCGAYVSIIDMSPNYAGVIEGAINSVANVAGFGAPYIAGLILYHEPSILGWSYVFAVPAVLNLIGNLVFLIGAEVKVQRWNDKTGPVAMDSK